MNGDNKHTNSISEKITDNELLDSLKGKNSFVVPDDYFNGLESDILAKTIERSSVKDKNISKYIYFAVAASVIALMFFASMQYFNKSADRIAPIVDKENTINLIENNNNEIVNNDSKLLTDTSTNNSRNNTLIEQEPPKEINALAINKTRTPKINKKEIKEDSKEYSIQESQKDDININNEQIDDIQLASNDVIIPNTISYNSNVQANNQATIRTIARLSRNQQFNVFLPYDTCVNSSFTYLLDTIGLSNLTFSWDKEISMDFNESGIYTLIYFLQDSLLGVDTMHLTIVPKPKPTIQAEHEICNHESLLLNAGINNEEYSYEWSVSDLNRAEVYVSGLEPGNKLIKLKVTSCADTVFASIMVQINDCQLMIPNVFTPNGDGVNDYFVVKGLENYPGSSLTIIGRNGNVVFQAMDYKNDWNAENIESGTYFYSLRLNDKNKTEKGGVINIVR